MIVHTDRVYGTMRTYVVTQEKCTDAAVRFVAVFSDMPGCRAQGDDPIVAVKTLFEIAPKYQAAMRDLGVSDFASRTELESRRGAAMQIFHGPTTLGTGSLSGWIPTAAIA